MIELNKELYKKNLDYGHRWDAAIESRGDSPLSDARVFLALAIKLIEEKLVGGYGEEWIPIESRPGTEEEYAEFSKFGSCPRSEFKVYTNEMPEDGQDVLITTKWGTVCEDIYHDDVDASYFEEHDDPDDVIAWMPKPKGYVPEDKR